MTPGPEHQRRFEGQHQTPHQLINACKGDLDPARNNTNTSKTTSQAPILTVITPSHRKAVKSAHQTIDLNCCLVYHVSLNRRDGQRLQIEFGRHGMGLTKLDSHQHQCVMGVLLPCMRVSPDYFSKTRQKNCLFSHWYLSYYIGQISILFSNFACCTRWLATDEKRYASNCLTRWICLPEGYPACNSETKRPLFDFYTAWPFLIGWDWLAWKSILRCAFDAALSLLHTVCR